MKDNLRSVVGKINLGYNSIGLSHLDSTRTFIPIARACTSSIIRCPTWSRWTTCSNTSTTSWRMGESNIRVPPPPHELAALVFAVVLPTLVTVMYFVVLTPLDERIQQAAYGIGKAIQFAFPLVWVLLVCREPIKFKPPHVMGLTVGFAFGMVVLVAMLTLYYFWLKPAGFFVEPGKAVDKKVEEMGLDSTALYAATAIFYALVHSFLEEYYWRWFVFGRLERRIPFPRALILSSLGFMLHHVLLLSIYFKGDFVAIGLFSLGVALGGVAWGMLFHWTRSLSGPWLSHLLVDAGIFLLGYDLIRHAL